MKDSSLRAIPVARWGTLTRSFCEWDGHAFEWALLRKRSINCFYPRTRESFVRYAYEENELFVTLPAGKQQQREWAHGGRLSAEVAPLAPFQGSSRSISGVVPRSMGCTALSDGGMPAPRNSPLPGALIRWPVVVHVVPLQAASKTEGSRKRQPRPQCPSCCR